MAQLCIKKSVPRWYVGNPYGFHLQGNRFDVPTQPSQVVLQDLDADWDSTTITIDPKSDASNLIFTCKLCKLGPKHGTGTLTITVTNNDTTTDSTAVDGTYGT